MNHQTQDDESGTKAVTMPWLVRSPVWITSAAFLGLWQPALPAARAASTEKAIEYLAREVPGWQPSNHCFACHHNGDGARALFVASASGSGFALDALRPTLDWLSDPAK